MMTQRRTIAAQLLVLVGHSASYNALLWKNPHNRFMKQELPIAFCLLAAGAAFWGWTAGNGPAIQARSASECALAESERPHARTAALGNPSRIPARTASHSASRLTSLPTRQSPKPTTPSANPMELGPRLAPADFRTAAGKSDDAQAEMLLCRAQHMIDDGPAFESTIRLLADLFGQSIAGSGSYSQAGQGSGQTRTTLQFRSLAHPSLEPQQRLTSVCDGRFTYRLHHNLIDNERTLEFYDLTQIKRASRTGDGRIPAIPLGPGQLMTGGLAGLVKQLTENFQFVTADSTTHVSPTGPQTYRLRGTWKPKQLHHLVREQLAAEGSGKAITWDQLPTNLPHAAEIVLVATDMLELFPQRVTFYQFQSSRQVTQARPIAAFQFAAPQPITNASNDRFVMKSDDLEATDVTQQYLSRLQSSDPEALR